ncbi:hypothetical protein ACIXFX_24795 [Bacteroides fragilis]
MIFSNDEFEELFKSGYIVDARCGGLVLGLSHEEGNIYMIRECPSGYEIFGHMEGGEYIIRHEAYLRHEDRIISINKEKPERYFIDIDILRKTPILQVSPTQFLLIDYRGVFIVNKKATCCYLEELNSLNTFY